MKASNRTQDTASHGRRYKQTSGRTLLRAALSCRSAPTAISGIAGRDVRKCERWPAVVRSSQRQAAKGRAQRYALTSTVTEQAIARALCRVCCRHPPACHLPFPRRLVLTLFFSPPPSRVPPSPADWRRDPLLRAGARSLPQAAVRDALFALFDVSACPSSGTLTWANRCSTIPPGAPPNDPQAKPRRSNDPLTSPAPTTAVLQSTRARRCC